jgi:hypothetical protein
MAEAAVVDQSYAQGGLSSPAAHAVAVTPHDTTLLTTPSRSLYVGTAGNVTVLTVGGETVAFNNVPAGAILPIRAARVNNTGTTASDIVSLH